jgi:DNA helicase-2/ATP-dependent DNA helicase PcrA
MVEARLELEPEVQEIFCCIDNNRNFLLSGGAGSGKTYSLVQVIRQVIVENPTSKVACMTYTNAAVKEIEDRVNHQNLNVSTIHDFLWDNIKHFQKELKTSLIALINDENMNKLKIDGIDNISDDYFDSFEIQYKEHLRIREGDISHNEILIVANYMFNEYVKLCDIVKDKYKFIFIDEYQDTSKYVVEIFLKHFKQSRKQSIIGFFGDAMQSIYDDGICNLDDYKGNESDRVFEIQKKQNRRNPKLIIDLANRLRTDGIQQEPSLDKNAPNMIEGIVKEGKIKFIHSIDGDINKIKKILSECFGWNFADSKETKELNLTHNLIAEKAGFRSLMDIYDKERIIELKNKIVKEIKDKNIIIPENVTFGEVIDQVNLTINPTTQIGLFISQNASLYGEAKNYPYSIFKRMYINKDQLVDDKKQDEDDENKKGSKRDNLIKHLFKIQKNISLYQNEHYNEFLRVTDFNVSSIKDKITLKKYIEEMINVSDKTIEDIIINADEKGICLIDDRLNEFQKNNEYIYNRVKDIEFREFQKLYEYLEGKTPFSTQHKTKGAQFNNILVILDNGRWNDYNFEYLFTNRNDKESILRRTQKIFYMCCTRAKENLAVFYHAPNVAVIDKAEEWFGKDNVLSV